MRGQRQAKATLFWQMEADILRMVVMRLYAQFRDLGMRSRVVMTIHDAIYVEAPREEEQEARKLLKEEMGLAVELPVVPMEVDLG